LRSLVAFPTPHLAAIPCVVGWDAERVELGGDATAAPSVTGEPVVDQANDVSRRHSVCQRALVGDEVGGLADTFDPIAVGDDPAGIEALAGRPVQAVARAP